MSSTSRSAKRAIERDRALAEGYAILARVLTVQRKHVDVIATLEKALSLNPNRAETYGSLANTSTSRGTTRRSDLAGEEGDPRNPVHGVVLDLHLGRAMGAYDPAHTADQQRISGLWSG